MINLILTILLSLSQQKVIPTNCNVLEIIMDDVGYQDITEMITPNRPNITALSNAGLFFDRAYAQPICETARHAGFFGFYTQGSGNECFGPDANTPDISTPCLSRIFKSIGYNTGFFGKWHIGDNSLGLPWEETPHLYGFDFIGAGNPNNIAADVCGEGFSGDYNHWLRYENQGPAFVSFKYESTAVRNQFMLWWANTKGPKFAYVAFQAAHAPFHDPPADLVPHQPVGGPGYSTNRIQFEKMIISIDTMLGQMANIIDLSNTYIVLIGDNGTPPNARSPSEPIDRYKTTPFEGGVHVPLIIAGPGITPGGHTSSLVDIVDFPATFADLFHVNFSAQDSISFAPILTNPSVQTRDHVFVFNAGDRAVIEQQFKLIRLQNIERFYDIINDPFEQHALNPNNMDPIIVQDLRDKMQVYLNRGL